MNSIGFRSAGRRRILRGSAPVRPAGRTAFTLIELLVAIAIIAILAGLLLPALNQAQQKGQGIFCLNNTRQLALTWLMYAEDHQDTLVQNQNLGGPGSVENSWITGFLTWTTANDNTNLLFFDGGSLCQAGEVYGQEQEYLQLPRGQLSFQAATGPGMDRTSEAP